MNSDNFVEVTKAYKCFENGHNVLNGLNMTVPCNKIYGLLGPSGCGKTTLLQCVLNRISLDSGQVRVRNCNDQRSSIGYMPQEISLYQELSVKENIIYFGILSGLDDDVIHKRLEELVDFLLIRDKNALVQNLSGGQQRRVSFAVSLLNEASELFILDEPTAGVDPIISDSIWEYLVKLVSCGNKTVIITTHYIEEARKAHIIGFMRHGQILIEDSPNNLMCKYNCDTLEDVFLALIRESQEKTITTVHPISIGDKIDCEQINSPASKNSKLISFRRIEAMTRRNIFWMRKNIGMLLFVIFLPILLGLLFMYTFGRSFNYAKLAIVNHEVSRHYGYTCPILKENKTCDFRELSCEFMKILERKKYILIEYDDVESAIKSNPWAVIYFQQNFSQILESRINRFPEGIELEMSDINVYCDSSNYIIWFQITKDLIDGYQEFSKNIYADCNWTVDTASLTPLQFRHPIHGSKEVNYLDSVAAIYLAILAYYASLIFSMGSIMWERTDGKMERTLVAGGTFVEICLSQVVTQVLMAIIDIFGLWFSMITICGAKFIGDPILGFTILFLLTSIGIANGTFIGVSVSVVFISDLTTVGTIFSVIFLSGLIWPYEGMHWALRSVRHLCPTISGIEAFNAVALRGWSLTHPVIYMGLFSSIAWIVLFIIGISFVINKKSLNL